MKSIAMYTSPITGKTARAYYSSDLGEYTVKLLGSPHGDYFTDDKADAIGTMKMMADCVPTDRAPEHKFDFLVTIDCGDGVRTVYARTPSLTEANRLSTKWRAPAIERVSAARS